MTTKSRLSPAKRLPQALTNTAAAEALASLLFAWTKEQMQRHEERKNVAEPTGLAADDLRRFLVSLVEGTQPALDAPSSSALQGHLKLWSRVEGDDVLRIFLKDYGSDAGEVRAFLAGLALSPNRAFTWRLVHPSYQGGAINMASFKQMLWVGRFEFINDCIHDFGHPLPIMELADIQSHMSEEIFQATLQRVLTPAELAYCLAYGVFQLDTVDDGVANFDRSRRMRLTVNPLFAAAKAG
ncbi:MAG: hypothetical protein KGS72_14690 [Cyanobacteria bacterium REEB67]|nr:hypothetical protein [Cyanobacteria bacterium REEB67]